MASPIVSSKLLIAAAIEKGEPVITVGRWTIREGYEWDLELLQALSDNPTRALPKPAGTVLTSQLWPVVFVLIRGQDGAVSRSIYDDAFHRSLHYTRRPNAKGPPDSARKEIKKNPFFRPPTDGGAERTRGLPYRLRLKPEKLDEELKSQLDDWLNRFYRGPGEGPPGPPQASFWELTRLPTPASAEFVGREEEMVALDEALASPTQNIFVLVASGGSGKSALVRRWIDRIENDGKRGLKRAFAWSFYSQGTTVTDRPESTDQFFAEALRQFGWKDDLPTDVGRWPRELAKLIQSEPTLLVIDGIEPLQSPPGERAGQLKNQSLAVLLKLLAAQNNGLCIVTTRVSVRDIEGQRTGVQIRNLDKLSPTDGAHLLALLGVRGSQTIMETASASVGHHAFAVTLLGRYIQIALNGDGKEYGRAKLLEPGLDGTDHAKRMMDSHVAWFELNQQHAEVALLRLMGLFDRPVPRGAMSALLKPPALVGLTEPLSGLSPTSFEITCAHLQQVGLLLERDQTRPWIEQDIDAHPLVREHFSEHLMKTAVQSWKAGHERLFDYFSHAAPDLPETFEDMQPLYQAIRHGCACDQQHDALEVFMTRIRRGLENFSAFHFGAYSADLNALATFFVKQWDTVSPELEDWERAYVLYHSGYALMVLAQSREANIPLEQAIDIYRSLGDPLAPIVASHIAHFNMVSGQLTHALNNAQRSITLADELQDTFSSKVGRIIYGTVLHYLNRTSEADAVFVDAERLSGGHLDKIYCPIYCSLLIDTGRYREVLDRGKRNIEECKAKNNHLDIGLTEMVIAQALEQLGNLPEAETHFDESIARLKAANHHHLLAVAFSRRASFRSRSSTAHGLEDLAEAFDLTEDHIPLVECDARIVQAQLLLENEDIAGAQRAILKAREIATSTGYKLVVNKIETLTRLIGERHDSRSSA